MVWMDGEGLVHETRPKGKERVKLEGKQRSTKILKELQI